MRNLTFGQSIGVEPLPSQLALGEVSQELAASLWAVIYGDMNRTQNDDYHPSRIGKPWTGIVASWSVYHEHRPIDEISNTFDRNVAHFKSIIFSRDYVKVFNFIQFLIRYQHCPDHVFEGIEYALLNCRAAYRLVDRTVVPISTEEEAQAISHAFAVAAKHKAQGPRTHLQASAKHLTAGDWSGAIRESVHAVEAAAKAVEPEANELGPALSRLEKRQAINPAMKRAFGALYGFSSDEKGIRHSLVYDEKANVSEADAMFMFGACAAFVSYLLSNSGD